MTGMNMQGQESMTKGSLEDRSSKFVKLTRARQLQNVIFAYQTRESESFGLGS